MTQQLVIPQPDEFGLRVSPSTPLAHVVAVLRRHNPRAPFGQLKSAAESLRSGNPPAGRRDVEGEVSRDRMPEPFDSAVDSGSAVPQDATATEPESEVAPPAVDPEVALSEWNPARAAVAAWVAKQRGLAKGLHMTKSGRIPRAVLAAYRQAHRDEYLASLVPVINPDGTRAEPMPADAPIGEVV